LAAYNAHNLLDLTGTTKTASGIIRSSAQPSVGDLLSHIFLIHGLIPKYHASLLGVTWSLSLEMQFYLLFPALFILLFSTESVAKQRLFLFLLIAGVIALVMPSYLGMVSPRDYLHIFYYTQSFFTTCHFF
jgi:peptidoglycan/LPS O-acetylase OafA/YrhL